MTWIKLSRSRQIGRLIIVSRKWAFRLYWCSKDKKSHKEFLKVGRFPVLYLPTNEVKWE